MSFLFYGVLLLCQHVSLGSRVNLDTQEYPLTPEPVGAALRAADPDHSDANATGAQRNALLTTLPLSATLLEMSQSPSVAHSTLPISPAESSVEASEELAAASPLLNHDERVAGPAAGSEDVPLPSASPLLKEMASADGVIVVEKVAEAAPVATAIKAAPAAPALVTAAPVALQGPPSSLLQKKAAPNGEYNKHERPGLRYGNSSKLDEVSLGSKLMGFYGTGSDDRYRTFHAVFMVTTSWQDDRLKNQFDFGVKDRIAVDPEELWTPNLTYLNQVDLPPEVRVRHVEVTRGGLVTQEERCNQVFMMPQANKPFALFPFDSHKAKIVLTSFPHAADEVMLVAPGKNAEFHQREYSTAGAVENPEWSIEGYSTSFAAPNADSVATVEIRITRKPLSILMMTVLPLIVVVVYALTSLSVPGSDHETRSDILGTAVLTVVGVLWIIQETLPPVTYLVWLQGYALVSLIIIVFALLAVTLIKLVDPQGGTFVAEYQFEKALTKVKRSQKEEGLIKDGEKSAKKVKIGKMKDFRGGSVPKSPHTKSNVSWFLSNDKPNSGDKDAVFVASGGETGQPQGELKQGGEEQGDEKQPLKEDPQSPAEGAAVEEAKGWLGSSKERIKEAFDLYDMNDDGRLSREEITQAMGVLNASTEDIEAFIKDIGIDEGHEATFEDFSSYILKKEAELATSKRSSSSSMMFSQKLVNLDNEQKHNLEEVHEALKEHYQQLQDEHIEVKRNICCFHTNDAPRINRFLRVAVPVTWIVGNIILFAVAFAYSGF